MKKNYKKIRMLGAGLLLGMFGGTMNAQLSGVYTINSGQATGGTNYQTFSAFASDINSVGVSGAVTVNVVSGTGPYNEQVTFNQVSGVSQSNKVIINGNNNVLTFQATSSGAPWTLGLNGTDHFTVNDLDVRGTGSTYALVCKLSGGADYNTFYNCQFTCNQNQQSSGQCPFSISSNMTSATAGGSASGNYNTVNSCTLTCGYYSYVSYGLTSAPYTHHNTIMNSRITDWYYYGPYFYYNQDFTMKNCTIDRVNRTNSTTMYLMYAAYNNNCMIDGNRIEKLFDSQPGATGTIYMYMYYQAQQGVGKNVFRNNILTDIKHNGSFYPYAYYGAWDFLHNTFDWDWAGGNHTGTLYSIYAYSNSSYGTTRIMNNIITMRKPGSGTRYGIYTGGVTSDIVIDGNNIVPGTGSGNNYIGYYTGNATNLAAWQAMGPDPNGFSIDPQYTSATDLHPTNTTLNNQGIPVGVFLDNELKPRSGTTPDIGALEFLSVPCTGTPNPGSVVSPTYAICPGESADFILSNFSSDLGITYQWSSSTTSSVGPFTPVSGATTPMHTAPNITTPTWFQAVVTCTNSSQMVSPVGFVDVAGTTTNTVPYFENFEGISKQNQLPNCSWLAPTLGGGAFTYTSANDQGRMPRSGNKFASMYYTPSGSHSFFTNGIWLDAGVTYSASVWYTTEYYGYTNWTDLSIRVGPNQNSTGQQLVASTNGPAISNVYKSLSNTFTVASSGLYYVEVEGTSNGSCCGYYLSFDDLAIEIPCSLNSPTMNVASNQSTVCAGQPVNLTASGADTYSWSTGDTGDNISVTPVSPGMTTYYVTGTSTLSNCQTTGSQIVLVNPSPQINAFANPAVVCPGKSSNLQAFGATSYIWSSNQSGALVSVSPANTETYTVIGTNQYNCQSQAVVEVSVHTAPTISATHPAEVCPEDETPVVATGGVSYQFISPGAFYTSNPALIQINSSTQFTVIGTDANGCEGSYFATIAVMDCTGLEDYSSTGGLKVYPNPNNGEFSIETNNGSLKNIEVVDVTGRVVASEKTSASTVELNISAFANGVYYVKVQSQDAVNMIRIIKE